MFHASAVVASMVRVVCGLYLMLLPGLVLGQAELAQHSDGGDLYRIDAGSPENLRALFRSTGEPLPLVSAHRGGSGPGLPENCLATFENTLRRTFAVLEVDPRYTRDGAIVLHHDPTLNRTTTGTGRLADLDLAQVKQLRLKDSEGRATDYTVPTLDEALEWARGKTVLILDEKDVPVAARVKKIEEHRAEAYAMLIVYSLEAARECYRLNPNIMMEVMVTNEEQFRQFDATEIPWENIVAFVGHQPPRDAELLKRIGAQGTCRIAGTSRNLDRRLAAAGGEPSEELRERYRSLLATGVDLLETDLPRAVGPMLFDGAEIIPSKSQFFHYPEAAAVAPSR